LQALLQEELKIQVLGLQRRVSTADELDEVASLLAVRVVDEFVVQRRTPENPRFQEAD
jgi:hypothetical protein